MRDRFRCWAEIDLAALRSNLTWIRRAVGTGVRIMTVVKADAYGHGLRQIAAHLMQSGTDYFGVANLAEARAVRQVGSGWPVLLLGACLPHETEEAVRDGIRLTISSSSELIRLARVARSLAREAKVHLKVDTGMGRLGARPAEAVALARRAARTRGVRLEGIFTHFASAETEADYTALQERRFREVVDAIRESGIEIPLVHANNSAAILGERSGFCSLARPGLLAYGIVPPGLDVHEPHRTRELQPVLSLHSRVALVRSVKTGERLSYGGTFKARHAMRVAILTSGYGDGYPLAASNRAELLIHGRRCRVVGRVTMDQTLVEVTPLNKVRAGDEAVLIGRQGDEEISVVELAQKSGTIPWEVLTGISYRVPRIYRGGTAA